MFSDSGDSYCIYRACELVFIERGGSNIYWNILHNHSPPPTQKWIWRYSTKWVTAGRQAKIGRALYAPSNLFASTQHPSPPMASLNIWKNTNTNIHHHSQSILTLIILCLLIIIIIVLFIIMQWGLVCDMRHWALPNFPDWHHQTWLKVISIQSDVVFTFSLILYLRYLLVFLYFVPRLTSEKHGITWSRHHSVNFYLFVLYFNILFVFVYWFSCICIIHTVHCIVPTCVRWLLVSNFLAFFAELHLTPHYP